MQNKYEAEHKYVQSYLNDVDIVYPLSVILYV